MFILLAQNSIPLQFQSFVVDVPVPGNDGDCCADSQGPLPNLETPQAMNLNFPQIAMVEDVVADPVVHRNFPNITVVEESGEGDCKT